MLPESTAVYGGNMIVYWHGIIFAVAICATVVLTHFLRRFQLENAARCARKRTDAAGRTGVGLAALLSFPLALLGGRLFFCAFASDALLDLGNLFRGGYSLCGAMAGAVLGVWLTSRLCRWPDPGELLDAAAPAAALGIALGRMASAFSHEDLGTVVNDEKWQFFPFAACPGVGAKWYVAVFVFEALAALVALAVTLVLFGRTYGREVANYRKGDVFIAFLMVFCSSQVMMESMRSDSLRLKNNAFVRPSQIFWAVVLLAVVVLVCVWAYKRTGFRTWHIAVWGATAGTLGLVGFMEYRVIANKGTLLSNYIFMALAFLLLTVLGIMMLLTTHRNADGRR